MLPKATGMILRLGDIGQDSFRVAYVDLALEHQFSTSRFILYVGN